MTTFWQRTCQPPRNRAEEWLSLYTGRCAAPIDVTRFGSAEPEYVCGCGACPPPPVTPKPCTCGRTGTHRPDPGIGCTTPGCLCLEPAEHQ